MIPYGRQSISDEDITAVVEVLRSDWLTQGPVIPKFEEAVATYCGARYATAVSNATSALHLACRALGLGPGDLLWTSPNTFVASANCALYCGAKVDFVDIDPETWNLSVSALREKLECAEKSGTLPKIVVPVHFAGQPCDIAAIAELAHRYGFRIIEDASHAIGAEYLNEKVGNCRYSDFTVFSFHPVKIMTTGEGGLLTCKDKILHDQVQMLRTHGITRDESLLQNPGQGSWYYEQLELGYNYRITDLQAALGLSQLSRLDIFIARRRTLARRYDQLLRDFPVSSQKQAENTMSAFHLYPITLHEPSRRKTVFETLRENNIGVNVHYIPVHTQPYYRSLGFKPGGFPSAELYYSAAISLPIYFDLTDAQQDYICAQLNTALKD